MQSRFSRKELVALVAINILISVFFFFQLLFKRDALFGNDFGAYFYPIKVFLRTFGLQNINPFYALGMPFHANIQASPFYPLGVLYYIMNPLHAHAVTVIGHLFLCSIFMSLLARQLRVDFAPAILAGIVFSYNLFMVSHSMSRGNLTFVQASIWAPLAIMYLIRYLAESLRGWRPLVGFSLALACSLLGGFPQLTFYILLLSVIVMGYFYLVGRGDELSVGRAALPFVFIALAFMVASIELIPTLRFVPYSIRSSFTFLDSIADSFDPKSFITLLFPNFYGNPLNETYYKSRYFWGYWESATYVSIPVLILSIVSLMDRSVISKYGILFGGVIALSYFLALGAYNPLYHAIYLLPGFHSFKIPAQIIYLVVFSFSVLASFGLERILSSPRTVAKRSQVLFIFISIAVSFVATAIIYFKSESIIYFAKYILHIPNYRPNGNLDIERVFIQELDDLRNFTLILTLTALVFFLFWTNRISKNITALIIILLVVFDLYHSSSLDLFSKGVEETSPIRAKKLSIPGLDLVNYRITDLSHDSAAGAPDGMKRIEGNDPLIFSRYVTFYNTGYLNPVEKVRSICGFAFSTLANQARFLALTNVRYAFEPVVLAHEIPRGMRLFGIRDGSKIIEIPDALPMLSMKYSTQFSPPSPETVKYMLSDRFDYSKNVIVENRQLVRSGPSGTSSFSMLKRTWDHYLFDLTTDKDGFLLLLEQYYPEWKVTIDSKPVRLEHANYLFMGVPVPEGKHRIEIKYVPTSFYIGIVVSCVGIILLLMLWIVAPRYEDGNKH